MLHIEAGDLTDSKSHPTNYMCQCLCLCLCARAFVPVSVPVPVPVNRILYFLSGISIPQGSSKTCINNCCKSKPCSNNGTCADVCSSQGKRFHCSCLHGYTGTLCQKPPTSCKDYYKTGANTTGNYSIVDQQNQPMTVYCDFSSEPGFVWTLIQSQSLANKASFQFKPFYLTDEPISEDVPNWDAYRLSLSHMKFIRSHTTHWRATCNFPTDVFDFRDYLRSNFDNFDLLDASSDGKGKCMEYEFLNIRGIECSNCTAATWYGLYNKVYISYHIDSSYNPQGCEFDAKSGSVDSEDNFGHYYHTNTNFRCTASPTSTTQIWFGSH